MVGPERIFLGGRTHHLVGFAWEFFLIGFFGLARLVQGILRYHMLNFVPCLIFFDLTLLPLVLNLLKPLARLLFTFVNPLLNRHLFH